MVKAWVKTSGNGYSERAAATEDYNTDQSIEHHNINNTFGNHADTNGGGDMRKKEWMEKTIPEKFIYCHHLGWKSCQGIRSGISADKEFQKILEWEGMADETKS